MPVPLDALERRRTALLHDLAQTGDMRKGSITETFRRCGKPACHCSSPDHPGHGPYYAFTFKTDGKTKTLQLRTGPRLDKTEIEVGRYREFRQRCNELIEVNGKICDLRPVPEASGDDLERQLKKKRRLRSSKTKRSSGSSE